MIKTERNFAVAIGVVLLVAIVVLFDRLTVSSDMGVFLPRDKSTVGSRVLLSQLDRGATANVMFVRISGLPRGELAKLSTVLRSTWLNSSLIQRVLNGSESLGKEDVQLVEQYRYLLTGDGSGGQFSVTGLQESLAERLKGLGSSLAALEKRFLRQDPTGQLMSLLETWQTKKARTEGPARFDGVWFSGDGKNTVLVLQTRTKGMDLDSHEASARYIESSFADVAPPGAQIELTGPGAFAVQTRDTIRADVKLLSILALLFVGCFLMLVFRSVRLVLLLFLPIIVAAIVAAAAVQLVFGNLHGITLAFGVTLTGVAIDYPIHFFAHLDRGSSAREHVRRIWPTLRLGVLTTVVAYAFLTFSNFEGLQQLGVFTIAGLLTAAAVTRWVLPLLVPNGIEVTHRLEWLHRHLERIGRSAWRLRPIATLAVLAAVVFLLTTDRPLRDFHVDALSPIPQSKRLAAREVRNDLKMWAGGKMLVAVGNSAEDVLQMTEDLVASLDAAVADGVIKDYDMAAQFLPSQRLQLARRDAIPGEDELRENLEAAMKGTPFRKGVFKPFMEQVAAARSLDPLTLEALGREGLASHIKPLLFTHDAQWFAPILLHGVSDNAAAGAVADAYGGGNVLFMSLKDETSALMRRVIDRMVLLIGLGTICIYILLGIAFRDWRRPVRILLPTLSSVVVVSAILVALGIAMNLFHLTALLLVVGLGLDYSLFFNRLPENQSEWSTTFRSLWICCLTTVLVFGLLVVSKTPPLHAVGITAAIGAALCLTFGAVWSSAYGQGHGLLGLDRLMRLNRKKESAS